MNHFAHLYLAQPTLESTVGNLLGDFARGIDINSLSPAVRAGLMNHRAVDRFTDQDRRVTALKREFSPRYRRFAGIALDIYFDHLLITHWSRLRPGSADEYIQSSYQRIAASHDLMPSTRMREVTRRMIDHDWFGSYRHPEQVAEAIKRVARRIRFDNPFEHATEDLWRNHDTIVEVFLEFFPDLHRHVIDLALETPT